MSRSDGLVVPRSDAVTRNVLKLNSTLSYDLNEV